MQVVEGGRYEQLASRQHRETIEIPAGRGTIYDRTGEPLAIGEQATTVYADPRNVVAPRRPRSRRGRRSASTRTSSTRRFATARSGFVFVERKADPVKAKDLERLGVTGFGFYSEERRAYPQGRVAAHVLGFAGTDNNGLDGLERSLDKTLAGKPGYEIVVRDPLGRAIDVVTSRKRAAGPERRPHARPPAPGERGAASRERRPPLGRTRRHGDRDGSADAARSSRWRTRRRSTRTASRPRRADARRNRAVTDLYEPGSTFKIVTVAAALEDNVVAPDTSFRLAPTIDVADRTIREAHTRGTETMTVRQILSESSNVGTITIAQRLGGRSSRRGSTGSGSGSAPASTSRARARASCFRTRTGRGRRSAPCRSGRASR